MASKNLVILLAFISIAPSNDRPYRFEHADHIRRLARVHTIKGMVPQEGLEPPTPSLRMTCSTS